MPKPRALHIFIVAEQFRFASKLATLIPLIGVNNSALAFASDQRLQTASTVCSAFSLELYLKCIIRMECKFYGRKHDLSKLFALIGRRNRKKIKDYWFDHSERVRTYIERTYKDDGEPVPNVDFDFVLSASKDAFVEMRYIYEQIVEGARLVILEKHPEWENARQTSPLPETSLP